MRMKAASAVMVGVLIGLAPYQSAEAKGRDLARSGCAVKSGVPKGSGWLWVAREATADTGVKVSVKTVKSWNKSVKTLHPGDIVCTAMTSTLGDDGPVVAVAAPPVPKGK